MLFHVLLLLFAVDPGSVFLRQMSLLRRSVRSDEFRRAQVALVTDQYKHRLTLLTSSSSSSRSLISRNAWRGGCWGDRGFYEKHLRVSPLSMSWERAFRRLSWPWSFLRPDAGVGGADQMVRAFSSLISLGLADHVVTWQWLCATSRGSKPWFPGRLLGLCRNQRLQQIPRKILESATKKVHAR